MIGDALIQNLGNLFNPNPQGGPALNNIIGTAHFVIKIRRDNILEDSLNALLTEDAYNNLSKKPLRVIFVGEPAIDEGGVKKEFF
jgi:hypothetical protein